MSEIPVCSTKASSDIGGIAESGISYGVVFTDLIVEIRYCEFMSTAPVEIRPWRECPFIRGKRYRVRRSFPALRDAFTAGEVLTFESDAWSRYDGLTGYCFRQPGRDALRVWDIDDEGGILVWRELFEEISDTAR